MKYAVVENGSNQLVLKEGDTVLVDQTGLEKGSTYVWENILIYRDGETIKIGTPYLEGVKVTGKTLAAVKGPKVVNFKKKRRKGYTRKVGHRQKYTEILVEEIK